MPESEWDKTYETNYQSPLWRMVKERAEKKDISYFAAYREVLPEYQKTIRYKDIDWVKEQIRNRNKEIVDMRNRGSKVKTGGNKGCL
jgi:hypothetical protein